MARPGTRSPCYPRAMPLDLSPFDHALLADDTPYPFVIQCEQFKTSLLIQERLAALPNVEALFDHEVVAVEQGDDDVTITV